MHEPGSLLTSTLPVLTWHRLEIPNTCCHFHQHTWVHPAHPAPKTPFSDYHRNNFGWKRPSRYLKSFYSSSVTHLIISICITPSFASIKDNPNISNTTLKKQLWVINLKKKRKECQSTSEDKLPAGSSGWRQSSTKHFKEMHLQYIQSQSQILSEPVWCAKYLLNNAAFRISALTGRVHTQRAGTG